MHLTKKGKITFKKNLEEYFMEYLCQLQGNTVTKNEIIKWKDSLENIKKHLC